MALSNVSHLTLRVPLYLFVFLFDWYRNSGACGVIPNCAMMTGFGLFDPGMCIPSMGYIVAINFNCSLDI